MNFSNTNGVAQVTIKMVRDVFQAIVTRDKEIDGRIVPQVEYVVESLSETTLRNTLKRCGYPSSKTLVKVSR